MMKRPNWFVWISLGAIAKIYAYFLGLSIKKETKIRGPAFVLSNHASFSDHFYTTATVYPHRVSYLAASKMFYEPSRGPFLRLARAIPKSMFASDYLAIKKAFSILKQKGMVGIYPEGQLTYHGRSLKPPFGIAKLLKKANVPVYVVHIKNAYLRNPPWTKKAFKGKVYTRLFQLFTPEVLRQLSEEEIFKAVCEAIYFDPGTDNQHRIHRYQVQPIKGLESLLYQCPSCLFEGLKADNHELVCPKCSKRFAYDAYGFLDNKSIFEWYHRQQLTYESFLAKNPATQLTSPVNLVKVVGKGLRKVGSGTLTLDANAYVYKGTEHGQEKTYTFTTKTVEYLPADIGINVQIYYNNEAFIFETPNPIMSTKFFIAGEYFYRLANKMNS